ncbi:MAG: hypothetical protein VW714_08320 [Rhodospirillales bacterium]
MSNDLKAHCESIAYDLENGLPVEQCHNCDHHIFIKNDDGDEVCESCEEERGDMSGFDYLNGALDIEYVVDGNGDYLGARVLVAFGGPNIWINTRRNMIEGAWWDESCAVSFTDNIGLDDTLSELWGCR